MELYFNELSAAPSCPYNSDAISRVITLLETMKALREPEFGFTILRTNNGFYGYDLGGGYTFSSFLNDPTVSRTMKDLLQFIARNPFIANEDDEDSYEAQEFILNTFAAQDADGKTVLPEGLAVAAINDLPVLSLVGNKMWETPSITINITNNVANTIKKQIINLYSVDSLSSTVFKNWILSLVAGIQLNSKENIYLVFSPNLFDFDGKAILDILSWYYDDKRFLIRIKALIQDISANPFVGGLGHTETLAGTNGRASKRICGKDRIVYTYTKGKITIHQCRGHYDDK